MFQPHRTEAANEVVSERNEGVRDIDVASENKSSKALTAEQIREEQQREVDVFVEKIRELPPSERGRAVVEATESLFVAAHDWRTFYRQVLGIRGIVNGVFKNKKQIGAFEKSAEFGRIQELVAQLRERPEVQPEDQEPTKVITVRLPRCVHESLIREAGRRDTSMNKLCISKLMQMIDEQLVPSTPKKGKTDEKAKSNGKPG